MPVRRSSAGAAAAPRAAASHPLLPCSRRRCAGARPVAGGLGRRRRPADRPVIGQRARNGGRWRRDLALRPAHAGLTADWLAGCSGGAAPDSPIQPALLSAIHPFFCSVPAVFLARPTSQSRRAPLPLAVAAGSLLPASRRVPGPVAGLRRTPVCSCQHNLWSNHTILVLYFFTLLP